MKIDNKTMAIDDIDIRFEGAPVFNHQDEIIGILA